MGDTTIQELTYETLSKFVESYHSNRIEDIQRLTILEQGIKGVQTNCIVRKEDVDKKLKAVQWVSDLSIAWKVFIAVFLIGGSLLTTYGIYNTTISKVTPKSQGNIEVVKDLSDIKKSINSLLEMHGIKTPIVINKKASSFNAYSAEP